jgi:hypothetical protein
MSTDPMDKFEFFLGTWDLDYKIPRSIFSKAGTDKGTGTFMKILNDQYVLFEYSTQSGGEAKGIFAWDEKAKIYRYWWFENSGSFLSATCNFIDNNILAMNWHDTILIQSFTREGTDKVVLRMQYPTKKGEHETVLEVTMIRKSGKS